MSENTVTVEAELFLEEIQAQHPLSIWIPTLGKYLPFKHLTLEHHNKFLAIDALQNAPDVDQIDLTFQFLELLNKVLQECLLDKTVKIEDLTTVDRNVIALQLRVAIDDKFKVIFNKTTSDVSLKEHVSFVTTIGNNKFQRNIVIMHENFGVTLDIPSVLRDSAVNSEILAYDRDSESFPAFILFAETVKFIKSVIFVKQNDTFKLDLFKPGEIETSIKVCRMLPMTLLTKIAEYISNVYQIESQMMSFKCKLGETEQSIPIVIDSNWFTSV